ncbi:hypothetical protein K3495_g2773 [Podosphaera aphanis]|nr:hypothetical protein K3495_g2773 [Podosphaera aphanis]
MSMAYATSTHSCLREPKNVAERVRILDDWRKYFVAIGEDVVVYSSMTPQVSNDNVKEKLIESMVSDAAMKLELDKIISPDVDEFTKQKWDSANTNILFMLKNSIKTTVTDPLISHRNSGILSIKNITHATK